jgi:hypothetical protein
MRRLIQRDRDGTFAVRLSDGERDLVASLAAQLRELLVSGETQGTQRLFPPAYANDEDREEEYQVLTHDELLQGRLEALDVVEQSVTQSTLTEDELTAWMGAINAVRLVLGTNLDITEDMDDVDRDDPRADAFAVYHYLTHLLAEIVDALSH